MSGRGTAATFVDMEDHLLGRTVSHSPAAADSLPSRAKKKSVELTVLLNKYDIFFAPWEAMYLRTQAKKSVNPFL